MLRESVIDGLVADPMSLVGQLDWAAKLRVLEGYRERDGLGWGDPKLRAVYYVRVLEVPTPRWTAYDAKRLGVKMPKDMPMFGQERAYTSPIWYTPKS